MKIRKAVLPLAGLATRMLPASKVIPKMMLPLVGTVLGVPIDAGFDWVAFALVSISLLRFFPAPLVAEHYDRIFNKRWQESRRP